MPKKGAGPGWLFTQRAVEDDVWRYDHSVKLAHMVQELKNVELLREVARVLGYAHLHPEDAAP